MENHHQYQVVDHYPVLQSQTRLFEALVAIDRRRFPSNSKARRDCKHEAVLIARCGGTTDGSTTTEKRVHLRQFQDLSDLFNAANLSKSLLGLVVGQGNSTVAYGDTILIHRRLDDSYYPTSVTKYLFPPSHTHRVAVVYQDEHLAVVHKPENITTIGSSSARDDLQSCLGFLLHPSPHQPSYHPRPVHRLDRRTSGLLLVAKTQATMRFFSRSFRDRTIRKTYTALVVGNFSQHLPGNPSAFNDWQTINYPIDGRPACSEWRGVQERQGLSLVQIRPHTGRTHQIRRHLAYCLQMPIVGDAKYDKGARHLRTNGMYLCCHKLEFPVLEEQETHNDQAGGDVNNRSALALKNGQLFQTVTIPLPRKFNERFYSH